MAGVANRLAHTAGMRSLVAVLALSLGVSLAAGTAGAEGKRAQPAKPAKAKAPAKATESCKKVGKGASRKTVCTYTTTAVLEVKSGSAKPEVVIIPNDGRSVTGRPRSDDRLKGLGPQTR